MNFKVDFHNTILLKQGDENGSSKETDGGRQRHVEPGLVAEPVEPQDPPPELFFVESDGRGVQLR